MIMIFRRGVADVVCDEREDVSCSGLQISIIIISLLLVAFAICILVIIHFLISLDQIPFSYVARRYWQALDSYSELIIGE